MTEYHKGLSLFWISPRLMMEFNGFISRIIPLWRSIAKTFSREFLSSLCPVLEFNGFNSLISPLYQRLSQRLFREINLLLIAQSEICCF